MLSPSETLCPPQPGRLQSRADSFYSRGRSKNVSVLVSISPRDFSPASSAKVRRDSCSMVQKVTDRNWTLPAGWPPSKPKPHLRREAFDAQTRNLKLLTKLRVVFLSTEVKFEKLFCWCCIQRTQSRTATPPSERILMLRSGRNDHLTTMGVSYISASGNKLDPFLGVWWITAPSLFWGGVL